MTAAAAPFNVLANPPARARSSTQHALDLSADKRHKTFYHRDITVIITWTLHDKRPCLVLVPTYQMLNWERVIPCIVPDITCWKWAEEFAGAEEARQCAITAASFADALGLPFHPRSANRVTSLIRDHLDDLLTCPPMPQGKQYVAGQTRLTDLNSGKTSEGEIFDDV